MKPISSLVPIEDLSVSGGLAGVSPGEECPHPIPMPQDTGGLFPKREHPSATQLFPRPHPTKRPWGPWVLHVRLKS